MTREEYEELREVISVKNNDRYEDIIYETKSSVMMYYLSEHRKNIISWLPIDSSYRVLEIGGECGIISAFFSDRVKSLDVIVEDSYEKELISKVLAKKQNVRVCETINSLVDSKYNLITMIDSLAKANKFFNNDDGNQMKLLELANQKLNVGGNLVIACPNRFGLKYFAGYKEDYTGEVYAGILGKTDDKGIQLYSKKILLELLQKAGFCNISFYYPYPDHVFTEEVYSDKYLPDLGDLRINNRDFFGNDDKNFSESDAWNEIIKEKMFPEFSNSYVVVAEKQRC